MSTISEKDVSPFPLLVVAGTGVPRWLVPAIYFRTKSLTRSFVHFEGIPALGLGHIHNATLILEEKIRSLNINQRIDIFGHSQGGLLALALGERLSQIRKVVTMGAPFGGTTLAHSWQPVVSVRCMSRGSRYLQDLTVKKSEVHSFFTTDDHCVIPYTSSRLEGANNYVISPTNPNIGFTEWIPGSASHTNLIFNETVLNRVRRILCSE